MDLPTPPRGFRTEQVLVIAPYFDVWFAKRTLERLRPRQIQFLVDDGSRAQDIESLRRTCPGISIGLGCTAGLVHLKAFYVEFRKRNGAGIRKRHFLFGSANATEAAFSGKSNAELLAHVELSQSEDRRLLDYLESISTAVQSGGGVANQTVLRSTSGVPRLFLPAFRIKRPGPPPGLDAWLQRGKLAAKYRDNPQFLRVVVTLRNSLPAGDIVRIFAQGNLSPQGQRNVVRYPYINGQGGDEGEIEGEAERQWRSQYSVWTNLGDWLSDECFQKKGPKGENVLVANAKQQREANIEQLLQNARRSEWRRAAQQRFIDALKKVWSGLETGGHDPAEYLRDRNGQLDHNQYANVFVQKLDSDLSLAADGEFRQRYISGYEFVDVPRFRQDAPAWKQFVRSWCESIVVEAAKRSTRSLVSKAILHALEGQEMEVTPEFLYGWLVKQWNGDEPGDLAWAAWPEDDVDEEDEVWFYRGVVNGELRQGIQFKFDVDARTVVIRRGGFRSVGEYLEKYFTIDLWKDRNDRGWAEIK